jgi:hypothetical protein
MKGKYGMFHVIRQVSPSFTLKAIFLQKQKVDENYVPSPNTMIVMDDRLSARFISPPFFGTAAVAGMIDV